MMHGRLIRHATKMLPGEKVVAVVPIEQGSASGRAWRIVPVAFAAFVAELAFRTWVVHYDGSAVGVVIATFVVVRLRPHVLVSTESAKLFLLRPRWLFTESRVLGEVAPDKVQQVEHSFMRLELCIDGDEYLTTNRAARHLSAMLAPLLAGKFPLPPHGGDTRRELI
jgi:hypothetical protein